MFLLNYTMEEFLCCMLNQFKSNDCKFVLYQFYWLKSFLKVPANIKERPILNIFIRFRTLHMSLISKF